MMANQRLGHRQHEKANEMTTIFTVKLGITNITPANLVEKGRTLVTDCTANANFTLPAGLLTGMSTACDNLEKANSQVLNNGGKSDTLLRDTRVREVRAQIKVLGAYVQAQSGGDRLKIASAGFEVHKSAAPAGVLPAPKNLRARPGKLPGEVDLRWGGVKEHLVYELDITSGDPTVETGWALVATIGRNFHTLTGLTTDKRYAFRVRAVGAAGPGPVSDSAVAKAS